MTILKISLNSVTKVKAFVNTIAKFDGDFDLSSGKYTVDAKSIMGIFSLDLGNPLTLTIHNTTDIDEINLAINEFLI